MLVAAITAAALASAPETDGLQLSGVGSDRDVDLPLPTLDGPESRDIINGDRATVDDWPMTGGMLMDATATVPGFGTLHGRALMCSSTLIAPDVVMLAAHCVDIEGLIDAAGAGGVTVGDLQDLSFGWSRLEELYEWDLVDSALNGPKDWPEDIVMASDWVRHEGFDLLTLETGLANNKDIALLFLEEPVLDVPFAILPTEEEAAQIEVGAPVTIVGWGQQQQDAVAGTVGFKRMAESSIDEVSRWEFQVGKDYDSGRKCHGDSGGPTFLEIETDSAISTRVVGVTSHAYDTTDCRVTGGVDTRVDHYLDWIDAEMTERCEAGTRAWCETPGIVPPPDASGLFPWELVADADLDDEDGKGGCGCDAAPGARAGLLPLLALLLGSRRSRRPAA